MKFKTLAFAACLIAGSVHAQVEVIPEKYRVTGIDLAWARGITGLGSRVAVIDSGFDLTHPDLRDQVIAAKNFYSNSNVTWGYHGTAMASIIAGDRGNGGMVGVAPDAKLILAQIGQGQYSPVLSTEAFNQALIWTNSMNAHIVNMSLSYRYNSQFKSAVKLDSKTGAYYVSPNLIPNIKATDPLGIASKSSVLVIAAGNDGLPYSDFPGQFASRLDVNGRLVLGGRMIVVGAMNELNTIASWSNRAGHVCYMFLAGQCRDPITTTEYFVVAPGLAITAAQARGGTASGSGTSQSAAYVSGGMALIKQAWPQLRPEQLVQIVLTTTKDLGAPGIDSVYGRGLVDFNRATRPQGQVRLAASAMKLGTTTASTNFVSNGIGIADSRLIMTTGTTGLFSTSRVLSKAQVLDDYDRNYTADFTRSLGVAPQIYNADSAWLPYSHNTRLPVTQDLDLVIMRADSGLASELVVKRSATSYRLQAGSMLETSGYLGNSGHGALGLGSSTTAWAMFGIEHAVSDRLSVIAQYGQGRTAVINDAQSMIQTDPVLHSQSYRLGLRRQSVINEQDSVQISVASPVHITRGHAQVSAVTDYTYETDAEGNTVATPIVSTERIDLARARTQPVLALNYTMPTGDRGQFSFSWTAVPGANRFGLNYNYLFK